MLREITRTLNLLITAVRSGDEQDILRLARKYEKLRRESDADASPRSPGRGIMDEYKSAEIESAVNQELIAAAGKDPTPQQVEALKVKVATIRELNKK